jgi:hypothetical protein
MKCRIGYAEPNLFALNTVSTSMQRSKETEMSIGFTIERTELYKYTVTYFIYQGKMTLCIVICRFGNFVPNTDKFGPRWQSPTQCRPDLAPDESHLGLTRHLAPDEST